MIEPMLFASPADFDLWLMQHGASKAEIWLKLAKKAAAIQTLNYAQALDVALCHGWIDGVKMLTMMSIFCNASARAWHPVHGQKLTATRLRFC